MSEGDGVRGLGGVLFRIFLGGDRWGDEVNVLRSLGCRGQLQGVRVGWGKERGIGGLIPVGSIVRIFGTQLFIRVDEACGLEKDPYLPFYGSFNEAYIEL